MAGPKKTLESVKQGGRNIAFRDLQRLLEKLGFRLNRVSGSHHIYIHPKVSAR
jgi:predicted RNA binding protein YcfA (HicA-like mRNA interferase family)